MNEIVNKYFLARDKFMPETYLRQPEFMYSNLTYIYQNELDKACFQHDMAYGDFKDLTRITASDKYCVIKHLILLKMRIIMGIKEVLLQWFITFFIKKLLAVVLKVGKCQTSN